MSDNGRNGFDLTPDGRIEYLESLMDRVEPWVDYGPVFVEYLDDEDPQVRATAVRGLWSSPSGSLVDRLLEMAQQDASALVRAQAVSALGIYIYEGQIAAYDDEMAAYDDEMAAYDDEMAAYGDEMAAYGDEMAAYGDEMAAYGDELGELEELSGEDQITEAQFLQVKEFLLGVYADQGRTLDERRFAIESLSFLHDPDIADLIEEAYHRPEKDMKISAVFAMGRNGMTRWTDILGRELYNADRDIQREAIRAVGELGPPELGKDLLRLTYAEEADIMLEAIDALGQSGWEGAFERLEELTLHLDPEVAEVAEAALDEWLMWREIMEEAEDLDEDLDWDTEV